MPIEDGPDCGICGDDGSTAILTGPHPLLQDDRANEGTPRTPRGPAPPWAVSSGAPIDLTATGPTPPRSPTPPRASPPGLPDEESRARDTLSGASLAASFDDKFVHDLFQAARTGRLDSLSAMLNQVNGSAFALVNSAPGAVDTSLNGAMAAERRERAADCVASFLSHVRATGITGRETLLGAAASGGHVDAVQLLLTSRADPAVCDDNGCCALHRAAESGRLLTVLLVLDRLQATNRAINVAELTTVDGRDATPDTEAAMTGAADVCEAFKVFGEMQTDAEQRQLGSSKAPADLSSSHRSANTGELLAFVDLAAETRSAAGQAASTLLRFSTGGSRLVPNIFKRVPEDQSALLQLIDRTCYGIRAAEGLLLATRWNPAEPELDPAARAFVVTADLRSTWQRIRIDTVRSEGAQGLDDFWQTHLPAEMMAATLTNARGDTFQLLLTVLWLYTREAWLRHIVDTLACALCSIRAPQNRAGGAGDGATGATPMMAQEFPNALEQLEPLVHALEPLMQLVQSALWWFEEAGIRHTGITYRPLSLPMLGLQRLIDRYIAARREADHEEEQKKRGVPGAAVHDTTSLRSPAAAWVALGAGAFFSTMSSRVDAIRRLMRTHCNVMLVVRPDDWNACFPKQMSLRGNAVDDVLFPLGALFRITRITRTASSDLDPEACRGQEGAFRGPWPVMIIEVAATCRSLEAMSLLESRNDLSSDDLEGLLQQWVDGASATERHVRLLSAGELLAPPANGGARNLRDIGVAVVRSLGTRTERAATFLAQGASLAEAAGDAICAAHALLGLGRCKAAGAGGGAGGDIATELRTLGKKALGLLTDAYGANHPETCAARNAWKELGVPVRHLT